MLAKLLVFGVLLLTSSVLSEKDNLDSIYKAIKDIIGYDRSDIMKINEYIDAVQHGKQGKLDSHLLKKDRDFQKALNPLPLDASRFILSLMHIGFYPNSKYTKIKSWSKLESEFRGKISKNSCAILLKQFPGLAKYKLCTA
uniref:DUF2059 domain-containing protein n=1 Tax=Haemonchus contortus TaxID=6289 RepID=A0A7I4YD86_HAECO